MTKRSILSFSTFEGFSKTGNGGVFEISNSEVFINCCSFLTNSCTEHGGGFYMASSILHINKTSFEKCYSSAKTDGKEGNAIFYSGSSADINEISTFMCGISEYYSDSSIAIFDSIGKTTNYNASTNYGIKGASGIRYSTPTEGSIIKFIQVIDSHDHTAIEINSSPQTISSCNFLNFNNNLYVLYENGNSLITLINCIFWDIEAQKFESNGYKYAAIDCYSNCFSEINLTSSANINIISNNLYCNIRSRKNFDKCHKSTLILFILSTLTMS